VLVASGTALAFTSLGLAWFSAQGGAAAAGNAVADSPRAGGHAAGVAAATLGAVGVLAAATGGVFLLLAPDAAGPDAR
jgi:hypothetical protein